CCISFAFSVSKGVVTSFARVACHWVFTVSSHCCVVAFGAGDGAAGGAGSWAITPNTEMKNAKERILQDIRSLANFPRTSNCVLIGTFRFIPTGESHFGCSSGRSRSPQEKLACGI